MLRVTACKLAPTIASPAPTIIAKRARGKRISQTMASRPFVQVCSISPGQTLFERMAQTVLVDTGTVPTDTAKESETDSITNPPMLKSNLVFKTLFLKINQNKCVT